MTAKVLGEQELGKRIQPGSSAAHDQLFCDVTLEWAHGRCAWFALAATKQWGFPLVGFENDDGRLVHVACRTIKGLFDAYGLGTDEQINGAFNRIAGAPTVMIPVEVSEQRVREDFMLSKPEHNEEIDGAVNICKHVMQQLGIDPADLATAAPSRAALTM